MAIDSTELVGPAPARPLAGCTVSDRWIVCAAYGPQSGALLTTGRYTVFDADAGTDGEAIGAWSGLGDTITSFCELGGAAWTGTNGNLHRIGVDGSLTTWAIPGASSIYNVRVAATSAGRIWCLWDKYLSEFNPSSEMFGTAVTIATDRFAIERVGSVLYLFGSTKVDKHSASDGSLISTITPGSSMGFNTTAVIDGDIWWGDGTKVRRYRTATDTLSSVETGVTVGYRPAKRTSDGLIYLVQGTTVHTVDPATMWAATDTLPTSRANRYSAFSARGRVYMPSGAPY